MLGKGTTQTVLSCCPEGSSTPARSVNQLPKIAAEQAQNFKDNKQEGAGKESTCENCRIFYNAKVYLAEPSDSPLQAPYLQLEQAKLL